MTRFDPLRLLRVLIEHDVEFVVIGATAAWLQGNPTVSVDLDIMPRRDVDNAERLADALTVLEARTPGSGQPRPWDVQDFLGWRPIQVLTSAGPLDLVPEAAGVGDYEDLIGRGVRMDLGNDGATVTVASLDDVIASKEALDRPKDRAALPALYATRRRLHEGER